MAVSNSVLTYCARPVWCLGNTGGPEINVTQLVGLQSYNISITNTGTGTGSSYTTYEAYKEEFTLLTIEQRLKLIR